MMTWREVTPAEVRRTIHVAPVKSCSLDWVPTYLLRDWIDVLLPYRTAMVNASLWEGSLPESQKRAVVTPLVKKPSLYAQEMRNYRPVSNLSLVSQLVERIVVTQLMDYLTLKNLLPPLQSAYRRHHSTETAMLKVLSDVFFCSRQSESYPTGFVGSKCSIRLCRPWYTVTEAAVQLWSRR